MKKTMAVLLCVLLAGSLIACNTTVPPGSCWADLETIVYAVSEGDSDIGTLTAVLERAPQNKTIGGKEYGNADTKLTLNFVSGEDTMTTESLLDGFTPLATYKKVATKDKNYELTAEFTSKKYSYKLTVDGQTKEADIKIKLAGAMDNELLYTVLRTDSSLASISASYNVPDPFSGTNGKYACAATGKTQKLNVPFPAGAKDVDCVEVLIKRTETPIGSGMTIYYTPDGEEITSENLAKNKNVSKKLPVKIVENNLTYTCTSIKVG